MSPLPLDDTRESRERALAVVARDGFAWVAPGEWLSADACVADPWGTVERLVGRTPRMVERQPIRPVQGARSVAAGRGAAPLHTDSQAFCGSPPHLQVMACRAPAPSGGASLLVDAFATLERLAAHEPSLFELFVSSPRELRFYFGDFVRPTLHRQGQDLFVTHPPVSRDELGARLARSLPEPVRVPVARGEALLVDNHRMLHGRDAFDGARSFERVLAWLDAPLSPGHSLRARLGMARAEPVEIAPREAALAALLRGVPPGVVSARHGVSEPELYALRTAAFDAARGTSR